jgi:hypothetical protein
MHNLHYLLINAKTAKLACLIAEEIFNDYDDLDPNCKQFTFSILGALNVNDDNKVYIHKESHHWDISNFTINEINQGLSKEFNKDVNILADDVSQFESLPDECGILDHSDKNSHEPKFIVVLDVMS